MSIASELAARLEQMDVAAGMKLVIEANEAALQFDVIGDAMCIMHSDGSVNIVEHVGAGRVMVEVMSASNILRVLKHYRPFKDVFKGVIQ